MESNDYKHGLLWMDLQHEKLINWFHQLNCSCEKSTCKIKNKQIFEFLEWHILDYFAMEEIYMGKYGYDEYEYHKKEHIHFTSEYLKFTHNLPKKEQRGATELSLILANWIMKHVGPEDEKLATFLKERGIK